MSELRFPKINQIFLSGRLTRDVDLRYLPNGTPVAKLSLAFDRSYQKDGEWQQETSYIDVTVWSKRGEQCAEELHKGSPVLVEGYLRTRSYVDSNNQNRKVTEVVAAKISFLEKGDAGTDSYSSNQNDLPDQNTDHGITDDDVPF
ncbi:MAG TPA: single-stranded DNA-binding protein [Candidatus Cloacimonadota bacterium]|nr:single-stranded DNA-binding protein [Candidatus Cloacimonadota bacterium]